MCLSTSLMVYIQLRDPRIHVFMRLVHSSHHTSQHVWFCLNFGFSKRKLISTHFLCTLFLYGIKQCIIRQNTIKESGIKRDDSYCEKKKIVNTIVFIWNYIRWCYELKCAFWLIHFRNFHLNGDKQGGNS